MTKKLLSIVLPVGILGLILGGIFYTKHQEEVERQKMVAIATSDAAKQVYEDYLKKLDSKALTSEGKIKNYRIDIDDLQYNPMGGLMVRLYINNNPALDIQIGIIENQKNILEVFGATTSIEFEELLDME